jgi:hypothetical protein
MTNSDLIYWRRSMDKNKEIEELLKKVEIKAKAIKPGYYFTLQSAYNNDAEWFSYDIDVRDQVGRKFGEFSKDCNSGIETRGKNNLNQTVYKVS